MKRLVGKRLILEPVIKQNAATLWTIMQGRDLREYQDVPRYTRDEFERRVAARPKRFDARASGRFEWLIIVTATQTPVGWVSLRLGEPALGAAEIGYSVAATRRGAGYATEAARLVVAYAFESSDLARVEACCVPENLPSRRLLASLRFNEVRLQPHGAIVRGRPVDIMLYEISRERWRDAKPARSEAADAVGAHGA